MKISSLVYAWLRQLKDAANYKIDGLSSKAIENYKELKVGAYPTDCSFFQPERLNPETPQGEAIV
jgi:hypothetical protein